MVGELVESMSELEELIKELTDLKAEQEKINSLYKKLGLTDDKILIPCKEAKAAVKVNDIQVVKIGEKEGLEIFDKSGKKYQTRKSFDLEGFKKLLINYPQFIRTHENHILNLLYIDYFEPSPTESKGRLISLKYTGLKIPVSAFNSEKVKKYFKMNSLEHVTPWSKEYQAIIDENLREFDKEIRLMSKEELLDNFKFETTGEFNIREFMANMIWEYYNLLQTGKRKPVEGNIRTFWYVIKPTLGKVVKIDSKRHYGIIIDVFKRLAVTHRLFKYKDFGFISENQDMYQIGSKHPNIIFVGEKTGHFRKLKRISDEFGVTIISLGGSPSILTTEYLEDDMEKTFNIKQTPVHLITLVDYDPAGAIIAKTFTEQLKHEGIKNLGSISYLLIPSNFSLEEIEHITEPVPMNTQADKTKVKKWLEAGGGINGKPLGIESEALIVDFERLRNLFKTEFDNIINGQSETTKPKTYNPLLMDLKNIYLFSLR